MRMALTAAVICLGIAGCVKPPAEQCLDSFRANLKDPESGKVIGFTDNILTYTATNTYGARVQGKALCVQAGEKWSRAQTKELLMVLERTEKVLSEYNDCRKGGGGKESCAGTSLTLKYSGSSGVNVDELNKESARTLGSIEHTRHSDVAVEQVTQLGPFAAGRESPLVSR